MRTRFLWAGTSFSESWETGFFDEVDGWYKRDSPKSLCKRLCKKMRSILSFCGLLLIGCFALSGISVHYGVTALGGKVKHDIVNK